MSTSSTTTLFICRERSEPGSPRVSRNDMQSTSGSPRARCDSSASHIPFMGWSPGSSSRSLALDDVSEGFQRRPCLQPDVTLDDSAIRAQGPLPRDEDEVSELHAPGERKSDRGEIGLDRFFAHGRRYLRLP